MKTLIIIHLLVCMALCGSLWKNVCQAKEKSAVADAAYLLGKADGIHWARGVIIRAMIEQQIIAEREAELAKERL